MIWIHTKGAFTEGYGAFPPKQDQYKLFCKGHLLSGLQFVPNPYMRISCKISKSTLKLYLNVTFQDLKNILENIAVHQTLICCKQCLKMSEKNKESNFLICAQV